jgi:glucans biosynthesis protein C
MDSTDTSRRYFLDWLRIVAFGLLVIYHVGMYYVSWDWHIKSPNAGTLLEPWMRLVSPWRMDLLFLISGAATTFLLARRGASSEVLAARMRFLMLPLAFGMLVIVPPQAYLEVVHRFGYSGGYLDFMRLYLKGDGSFCRAAGHCLILPTWNHLWYLPYMAVYTLVLWAWLRWGSVRLEAAAGALPLALKGARMLWVPIAMLLTVRLALGSRFPPTHSLVNDWALHAQYLPIFLLGALLARRPEMWSRFVSVRWVALGLALVAWGLLLAMANPTDGPMILLRALIVATQQWCGLVAAVGFAARHLDRDAPVRRYLTDAVFPLYVLHQTVIIVLAHAIAGWRLTWTTEAPLLLIGTFALSFLGVELGRRMNWLRPYVGMRVASAGTRLDVPVAARQWHQRRAP